MPSSIAFIRSGKLKVLGVVNEKRLADSKEVQERLATLGCETFKGTVDQLAQIVKSDMVRWAKIVKDSGAKID